MFKISAIYRPIIYPRRNGALILSGHDKLIHIEVMCVV